MLYTKNIPAWERSLRIMLGSACAVFAFMAWDESALVVGAALVGATLALTGLFGFCPACAMIGRKL